MTFESLAFDKPLFLSDSVVPANYIAKRTPRGDLATCQYDQGIGAGRMDVYTKQIPGQFVCIDNLAPGGYWLEVEVNKDHVVMESDYTNNVSRVVIPPVPAGCLPASTVCGDKGLSCCPGLSCSPLSNTCQNASIIAGGG